MKPENAGMADQMMSNSTVGKWYRKKRVIIPLLFMVALALGVVLYWYSFLRGYVSTDDAFIDSDDVTISSKILGRVFNLGADEGDTVQQGDTLVRLDDSDLRAQEAQNEANLDYARKNAALSNVILSKARDDFHRAEVQFRGDAITGEQFEHARQALEEAQAKCDAAQSQIGIARAQLDVVRTQLANMSIVAPFAGVVARRWVIEGDVVQPAQPILTIYSLGKAWVTAYLEETKISSVRLDDPVAISIDSYPGRMFNGRIINIGATAASEFSLISPNNASGNFTKVTQRIPVKIAILQQDDDRMPLRAGMSVEIRIKVKKD